MILDNCRRCCRVVAGCPRSRIMCLCTCFLFPLEYILLNFVLHMDFAKNPMCFWMDGFPFNPRLSNAHFGIHGFAGSHFLCSDFAIRCFCGRVASCACKCKMYGSLFSLYFKRSCTLFSSFAFVWFTFSLFRVLAHQFFVVFFVCQVCMRVFLGVRMEAGAVRVFGYDDFCHII